MKRSGIRKNNRGDSLILVIGCIALLSIIGVVLLAKTMDNRKMKLSEEQAHASFVGAETGTAEMVTVIEAATLTAIETAFGDMMLEYSLLGNDAAREGRYEEFFEKKVKNSLKANTLKLQLEQALGTTLTDFKVDWSGDLEDEAATEVGYTETIRMKDVKFSYTTGGSLTEITTDICIKAQLPDISTGFNSGISCDFSDFALITDGDVNVSVANNTQMQVKGNVYTGGNLTTTGATVLTKINQAKKLLVKNELKVEGNAQVWVKADGVAFSEGEGIWAGGISVDGSTFDATDVNLYVRDDLSVKGMTPTVKMQGSSSEYIGYSGNDAASAVNHEKSSAITINEIKLKDIDGDEVPDKGLNLDLSGLNRLYINGSSYICENNNNWGSGLDASSNITSAEGVLQGESIAYKDMQALYFYPGSCLPQKHNPIIGAVEDGDIGTPSTDYVFEHGGSTYTIDLEPYLNPAKRYVTRTARLDNGATVATYVYLNFASEEMAAKYVRDYLVTVLGDNITSQISNLKDCSRIILPDNTVTLSNAIEYDAPEGSTSPVLTVHPSAGTSQKTLLDIASLKAELRYNGLFSSLRTEGGSPVATGYQMVRDGILSSDAFNPSLPDMCGNKEYSVVNSGETYMFYVHDGDLTIDNSAECNKYCTMKGILLVNGNLTLNVTSVNVDGLVLVTGEVTQAAGAIFTANQEVVEKLLTNENVAKYFRVYGDSSGHGFLSTEAVKISFDKWKKN